VRMDSAFFSDQMVTEFQERGVEFTISVPFERFAELKQMIQARRRWGCFKSQLSYCDAPWKPKKWDSCFRFLFIRRKFKKHSKESIGELKSQCSLDYVAVRRLHNSHLYMMSAVLTHNLLRELHMMVHERSRGTTDKRAALREFTEANTLRRNLLQRAGRITWSAGTLTMTMNASSAVKHDLLLYLDRLQRAA